MHDKSSCLGTLRSSCRSGRRSASAMRLAAHTDHPLGTASGRRHMTWFPTIRRFGRPGSQCVPDAYRSDRRRRKLSGPRWTELFRAISVTGAPPCARTTSPAGSGRGCLCGTAPGPGHGGLVFRPAAPAWYPFGPGRAFDGGPAGGSPCGDGIGSGLDGRRGAASARPPWARGPPGVLVPVVSVLFPARFAPGLSGARAGKAVRARREHGPHDLSRLTLGGLAHSR